ncbi:uncharacterized protein TrAFT101_000740 [Trichoderma asperellum]|uniref:uncharacterized protein n=1 Tax=Trichoderma asperellum TaxID=101201 RepID=UPI0033247527|nr:hypothetical protein TrAFT101_000740 [Trichoderma asperellum]
MPPAKTDGSAICSSHLRARLASLLPLALEHRTELVHPSEQVNPHKARQGGLVSPNAASSSLEQWRNPECVIAGEESLARPLCVVLTPQVATDAVGGREALLAMAFGASIVATRTQ